jgi:DNA-binding YbaB/EbfC family protein
MMDFMNILGKVKDLQAKMKEAQEGLVHITASAEAGAGMVKATVNGKKQVIKIEVDNDVVKPEDKEVMQDLIVAAINKALIEVDGKILEHMQKFTGGILPNIPGFDLSKFGL